MLLWLIQQGNEQGEKPLGPTDSGQVPTGTGTGGTGGTGSFIDNAIEQGKEVVTQYGWSIIAALLILIVGWIGARFATNFVRRLMKKSKIDDTIIGFVCNVTYIAVMVFVVIGAIQTLGIPTTSFVAVLGAAGLAIGFALQGSLGNIASGVMLIVFRPFRAGDLVEAAGVIGVVQEVQVFATIMNTLDNKRIIVPNGSITSGNIINFSANDTRRVDMVFGIGYDDDIPKAKKTLEAILAENELVLEEPPFNVAVSALGDSSVDFIVRPWVKTPDYWKVYWAVTEAVKMRFDAEEIGIPFPQRDVHIHQVA